MIDWSILKPVDIGGAIQAGYQYTSDLVRKKKMEGALAAYAADPTNPDTQGMLAALSPQFAYQLGNHRAQMAEKQAERERVGAYFTNPDRAAAKQSALQSGEVDIAKQIDALGDDEKKAAAGRFKAAAPVAYQALKLPYEQRKAYLQTVRPELEANGWTPQQIDAFDPSDQALTGVVHTNLTLEQAMNRDEISYKEVGPGARLVPFDSMGRPIAGTGNPVDNPTETTAGAFEFTPVPGARETSGYRTPEHNRDVGGVQNSYHTRRDANGQPMAHDFVPPSGMSMAELHSRLSSLNPNLDVINEGDHVHIEPKGGGKPNQAEIRAHAAEAIKAGADPAAVRQRAESMGVTL